MRERGNSGGERGGQGFPAPTPLWYIAVMARLLAKVFAPAIVILLACSLPVSAQKKKAGEPVALDVRITLLLAQIADQARLSDDLAFAARAQSQAATLLWPYDRERARSIFRQAFQSLARETLAAAERRQLREELLNRIASRDTELAEELARAAAYSAESAKESPRADADRRELLISVALQIVERDPYRAMALGQLSLGGASAAREEAPLISQNFARLLVLMRGVDASLSDLLFASAVVRLERAQSIDLNDIQTLGSYLVSSANPSAKDSLARPVIERFLGLAYKQIMLYREGRERGGPDEPAAIYFITRQLTDLFARYMPDRRVKVQRKIEEISEPGAFDRTSDLSLAQPTSPADIAGDARASSNETERDSLYARAALAWLAKGEVTEAQSAARSISNRETHDRVLAQIARRQTSEGRIDDAVAVALDIQDNTARVGALVKLAGAALASRDRVRAIELLDEAESEAVKAQPSIARAQSLLTIVSSFSALDTVRAFEVMQTAIKSINDIPAPGSAEQFSMSFESTLAVLAQADFDRALLLAQQLTIKDASLIAQLAVCRGGLARAPATEHVGEDEEAGPIHW
ncbi:MAG TPA: hypothetical protein VKA70_20485 [Blastocatellia bacterium]|nr:hypothetical protein [Blastocatellia bacterium]